MPLSSEELSTDAGGASLSASADCMLDTSAPWPHRPAGYACRRLQHGAVVDACPKTVGRCEAQREKRERFA